MLKKLFIIITIVGNIFYCESLIAKENNSEKFQNVATEDQVLDAVIKIFAVTSSPNFFMPWQNYPQSQGTGSGVVIKDNLILTNAHVVANQSFLMVRKQGNPKRYVAKSVAVCHTADLALLKVEDQSFYKDITPVEFGVLPELQEEVSVFGYPVGGDNISITKGVVSRIEPVSYSHSGRTLLAIQIDAAINPGNSGGPVLHDNKIIGLAFQSFRSQQNIGYVIPQSIINHFLTDFYNKKNSDFPELQIGVMVMENPDLRKWAKMRDVDTGIMVTKIPEVFKDSMPLNVNDVILAIDDEPIANNGSVVFRKNEIIDFKYLIMKKHIGDNINFRLLRDGKEMVVDYKLTAPKYLVKSRRYDITPKYYFMGGLLFVPLNVNFLDSWNDWWNNAPRELVNFCNDDIKPNRKEIVVLANIFADEVNVGYQDIKFKGIKKLNDSEVVDLRSFVEKLEQITDEFVVIELYDSRKIVLEIAKLRASTKQIMNRYRIPQDRSNNL
ncbi:serine protease [Lentisphaerota bacterium WC36G]|nr:trypsin-like peptidase domain-containing protein [Lentisphaerae bacterium WC36]